MLSMDYSVPIFTKFIKIRQKMWKVFTRLFLGQSNFLLFYFKMSHAEKLKLKREVEQSEPKDTSEVYVTAVQDSPMQEPSQKNLVN